MSVAIALARQVAVNTAPKSIPTELRSAGCTKMMYARVRKVVAPASISVQIDVPL